MKIIALIPARGGSKGIPNKNIKLFCGEPLIKYSIDIANKCHHISDVIVSTDSSSIADIAKKCGAHVPFIRPSNISQDHSPDIEFIDHYINWNNENNIEQPDLIVQLRPTYPIRSLDLLNSCINQMIINFDKYDSLRTVVLNECKSPFKMYFVENNVLKPIIPDGTFPFIKEPYNMCRQVLPNTYTHNGCIDIIKTDVVINKKCLSGHHILPVIMNTDEINDIDSMEDWEKAENRFNNIKL